MVGEVDVAGGRVFVAPPDEVEARPEPGDVEDAGDEVRTP
jgi:hypothetical protein